MKILLTLTSLLLGFTLSAQLVITEIMYNSPDAADSLEYIEIQNISNNAINLEGYKISNAVVHTFGNINLPANGFMVVARTLNLRTYLNRYAPIQSAPLEKWASGNLNNTGERIVLENATGAILDSITYSARAPWNTDGNGRGAAMISCSNAQAVKNLPSNWKPSTTNLMSQSIAPFIAFYGTPGAANTPCDNRPAAGPDFTTIGRGAVATIQTFRNDVNVTGTTLTVNNPNQGTATKTNDSTIVVTPPATFCGDTIKGTYRITNGGGQFSEAGYYVIVTCPVAGYPVRTIGQMNKSNSTTGVLDSLGRPCQLKGVVYGVNNRATGIQLTIIDNAGEGITVFNNAKTFGYTVKEGDEVTVNGILAQFNGLGQISADTLWRSQQNQTIRTPLVVTDLTEANENKLVRINGLTLQNPSQWPSAPTAAFNVTARRLDGATFTIRIIPQVDLYGTPGPTGNFNIVGLLGQFDNTNPFTQGYQLFPRSKNDLIVATSAQDLVQELDLRISPNPAQDFITVSHNGKIDHWAVFNNQGAQILTGQNFTGLLDVNVSELASGMYYFTIYSSGKMGSLPFVKQ
jgi:DNA/RNA endonuclease YhcR with UshA esterase domain